MSEMGNKIEQLKKLWKEYKSDWNINEAKKEYEAFLKKYPKPKKDKEFKLALDEYTNIKDKDKDQETEYFTHFVERETENCGKFRTASSFAYGVYKVNINNIEKKEKNKEKKRRITKRT